MKNVMMTVSRLPKPNMMICLVTCQILTLFKDTDPVRLYVTLFGAVLPIYGKFEFSTQIWFGVSYVTYLCCVQTI